MLYLEDLNVGDHFKSREYEMTLDEVLEFAHKYDPQVFHTDAEKAKDHPIFKGLAASGWHTSAVTMRLWTECFPVAYGLIGSESSLHCLDLHELAIEFMSMLKLFRLPLLKLKMIVLL